MGCVHKYQWTQLALLSTQTLCAHKFALTFLASAHNVVFIGGPGTGKTHLASAIGIEAVQRHGKRVR
jgi:DNA replication protein DnaC